MRHRRDALDGRAMVLQVTPAGRGLHAKIVGELVKQQKTLLADLSPAVRRAVVDVIRRLASAADARFRAGISTCEPSR